jgi:hypothetical protein
MLPVIEFLNKNYSFAYYLMKIRLIIKPSMRKMDRSSFIINYLRKFENHNNHFNLKESHQ